MSVKRNLTKQYSMSHARQSTRASEASATSTQQTLQYTTFQNYKLHDHTNALFALLSVFPPGIPIPMTVILRLWSMRGVTPSVARRTLTLLEEQQLLSINVPAEIFEESVPWAPKPITDFVPRVHQPALPPHDMSITNKGNYSMKNTRVENTCVTTSLSALRDEIDRLEKQHVLNRTAMTNLLPAELLISEESQIHDETHVVTGYEQQRLDDMCTVVLDPDSHAVALRTLKKDPHAQAMGQSWGNMRRASRVYHMFSAQTGAGGGQNSTTVEGVASPTRLSSSKGPSSISKMQSAVAMKKQSQAPPKRSNQGGDGSNWKEMLLPAPPKLKNPITTIVDVERMIVEAYHECLCIDGDWSSGPDDGYFFQNIERHCKKIGREFPRTLRWVVASLMIQEKLDPNDYPIRVAVELTSAEQSIPPPPVIEAEVTVLQKSNVSRVGFSVLEEHAAQSLTVMRALQRAKLARKKAVQAALAVAGNITVTKIKSLHVNLLSESVTESEFAESDTNRGLVDTTTIYRSQRTVRLHTAVTNAMLHFNDIYNVFVLAMTTEDVKLRRATLITLRNSDSVEGFYNKAAEAMRTSDVPDQLCRVMEVFPPGVKGITPSLIECLYDLSLHRSRKVHRFAQALLRDAPIDCGAIEYVVKKFFENGSLPHALALTCCLPQIPYADHYCPTTMKKDMFFLPHDEVENVSDVQQSVIVETLPEIFVNTCRTISDLRSDESPIRRWLGFWLVDKWLGKEPSYDSVFQLLSTQSSDDALLTLHLLPIDHLNSHGNVLRFAESLPSLVGWYLQISALHVMRDLVVLCNTHSQVDWTESLSSIFPTEMKEFDVSMIHTERGREWFQCCVVPKRGSEITSFLQKLTSREDITTVVNALREVCVLAPNLITCEVWFAILSTTNVCNEAVNMMSLAPVEVLCNVVQAIVDGDHSKINCLPSSEESHIKVLQNVVDVLLQPDLLSKTREVLTSWISQQQSNKTAPASLWDFIAMRLHQAFDALEETVTLYFDDITLEFFLTTLLPLLPVIPPNDKVVKLFTRMLPFLRKGTKNVRELIHHTMCNLYPGSREYKNCGIILGPSFTQVMLGEYIHSLVAEGNMSNDDLALLLESCPTDALALPADLLDRIILFIAVFQKGKEVHLASVRALQRSYNCASVYTSLHALLHTHTPRDVLFWMPEDSRWMGLALCDDLVQYAMMHLDVEVRTRAQQLLTAGEGNPALIESLLKVVKLQLPSDLAIRVMRCVPPLKASENVFTLLGLLLPLLASDSADARDEMAQLLFRCCKKLRGVQRWLCTTLEAPWCGTHGYLTVLRILLDMEDEITQKTVQTVVKLRRRPLLDVEVKRECDRFLSQQDKYSTVVLQGLGQRLWSATPFLDDAEEVKDCFDDATRGDQSAIELLQRSPTPAVVKFLDSILSKRTSEITSTIQFALECLPGQSGLCEETCKWIEELAFGNNSQQLKSKLQLIARRAYLKS